jgi:hypothetical protein
MTAAVFTPARPIPARGASEGNPCWRRGLVRFFPIGLR